MLRKIETHEEKESRTKKRNIIIAVIIGLIMLFSTAGYLVSDMLGGGSTKKIVYNGIKFEPDEYGRFDFKIGENGFKTVYNPEQTKNISKDLSKSLQDYYQKTLYLGIENKESSSQIGLQEVMTNINAFISRYNPACLNENCTEDYPIKNCSSDNILIFRESNSSSIKENDKCVILEYAEGDEERVADAFLFRILGVQ